MFISNKSEAVGRDEKVAFCLSGQRPDPSRCFSSLVTLERALEVRLSEDSLEHVDLVLLAVHKVALLAPLAGT